MFEELGLKATKFLYDHLYASPTASLEEKQYRYEHSLRVTHIGLELAKQEQANMKVVFLGTLLHDVGKFDTETNIEHGRESARIAREFLKTLPLTEQEINDICFSIACHVDGKAGYDYPKIIEADIVSDADNIDRFGAYRIHEMMTHTLSLGEHQLMKDAVIKRLWNLKNYREKQILGTKSGNRWFNGQLDLAIAYFENFLRQLNDTQSEFNT